MSYFTVLGEDVDQDGVRDDYELYVNKRFKDPNIRRALKYKAILWGKFMQATNVFAINKFFKEGIDASICRSVLSRAEMDPKKDEMFEIHDNFFNNPWRRKHFNKQGSMVERKVYSWGESSIMDSLKRCKIKFTDLHKTLQVYIPEKRYKYGMTPEEIKEFEEIVGIKNEKK